jgi:hypothetical protein
MDGNHPTEDTMKNCIVVIAALVGLPSALDQPSRRSDSADLQNQVVELSRMVGQLQQDLTVIGNRLSATQSALTLVQQNSVLELGDAVSLTHDADGNPTVLFKAVNLQVTNGAGTTDSRNGVGNIIVGYNEDGEAALDRTGSHNMVLGEEQSFPETQEFVVRRIFSEGDLDLVTTNNFRTSVGGTHQSTIGADQTVTVGGTHQSTIGVDQTVAVGGTHELTIGANQTVAVGGTDELIIGADQTVAIGGKHGLTIGADQTVAVGGHSSEKVGRTKTTSARQGLTVETRRNLNVTVGDEVVVKANDDITLGARGAITLGGLGATSLNKNDGTITISGTKINIKATEDVLIKGTKILDN